MEKVTSYITGKDKHNKDGCYYDWVTTNEQTQMQDLTQSLDLSKKSLLNKVQSSVRGRQTNLTGNRQRQGRGKQAGDKNQKTLKHWNNCRDT